MPSDTPPKTGALIAELEAAPTGNRELDAKIWCAVNGVTFRYSEAAMIRGSVFLFKNAEGDDKAHCDHPAYTTSLDAALDLVPDGAWNVDISGVRANGDDEWWVEMRSQRPPYVLGKSTEELGPRHPALALCIAALRARENANGR